MLHLLFICFFSDKDSDRGMSSGGDYGENSSNYNNQYNDQYHGGGSSSRGRDTNISEQDTPDISNNSYGECMGGCIALLGSVSVFFDVHKFPYLIYIKLDK